MNHKLRKRRKVMYNDELQFGVYLRKAQLFFEWDIFVNDKPKQFYIFAQNYKKKASYAERKQNFGT